MLLKADHKNIEALFAQYEGLGAKGRGKKPIVMKMIREIAVHTAIEEQVFYPAVRAVVKNANDIVLRSLEEHHLVKWTLAELEKMDPDHERFDAKVEVLMDNLRAHIEEEEEDLFPMVRTGMDRSALNDLGERLEKAKRVAPTRPHPRAPDTPPENIVTGMGAGIVDKARDAGRALVRKVTARGATRDGQAATAARVGRKPTKRNANGRKQTHAR
jgi:hemerythrin superfamily protein